MKKQKALFGGRVAEKRRRAKQWRVGAIAILVIVFFAGIAYVSHLPALTVSNITVSGEQAVSADNIINTARAAMQGSYFFLIPKTNAFFYPAPKMEKDILATYPRVASTTIQARGLTGIAITIVERQPHALWCSAPETCYLVDEHGFIFDSATGFSGNAYISYETLLQQGNAIGQYVLPQDAFTKTDTFLMQLKNDVGITPEKLVVVSPIEADIYLASGGRIMYDRTQDLSLVFNNIQTVFTSSEMTPQKQATLEYADFRYGNKVYYKFR